MLLVLRVVGDGDAAEGRVADRGVEELARKRRLGVVADDHIALRVQQLGDRPGDAVVLDAGVLAGCGHVGRHQPVEQADAHAGLQHPAAGEAQAAQAVVDRADHALAGVVCVLRRAAGLRVLLRGQRRLQALAQGLPSGVLVAAVAVREDAVSDLGGAPAGELGQQRRLFRRRLAAFGFELLDQLDDAHILLGRGAPRAGALQFAGLDAVVVADSAFRCGASGLLVDPGFCLRQHFRERAGRRRVMPAHRHVPGSSAFLAEDCIRVLISWRADGEFRTIAAHQLQSGGLDLRLMRMG